MAELGIWMTALGVMISKFGIRIAELGMRIATMVASSRHSLILLHIIYGRNIDKMTSLGWKIYSALI